MDHLSSRQAGEKSPGLVIGRRKRQMKKLKTRSLMIGSYTLIAAVVILLAIFSLFVVRSVYNAGNARFDRYGKGYGELCRGYSQYKEIQLAIDEFLITGQNGDEVLRTVSESTEKIQNLFQMMESCLKEKDELSLEDEIHEGINSYITYLGNVYKLYEDHASQQEITQEILKGKERETQIRKSFEDLIALMDTRSAEHGELVKRNVNYVTVAMIAVSIVVFVVILIVEVYMTRRIRIPLKALSDVSKEVAQGNLNVSIEKKCDDEFGDLMDDLNIMIQNMKEQTRIANEVSIGNLDLDVRPRGREDMLGNALRKMVEDNNRVLSGIKEAAMQVTTGSNEVAGASQSLAQGTTQQASAIEQITASMEEIAQRTKVNATDAASASELVQDAKVGAELGNQQMHHMMKAMGEINESSENISKIIKVIDDIAFQTNILALNAAVEAARAGNHGKGFAVVADEVRNLAGKSAAAARETAEMIEDSIQKVEKGSKLAAQTAEALDHIVGSVEKIVVLVDGIADASNIQAGSVAQIETALSQVSQVVQTNSATSEECAAASEELSNQAERLKQLLSKFQLRKETHAGCLPEEDSFRISGGYPETSQEPSYGQEHYDYPENVIRLGKDEYGKY